MKLSKAVLTKNGFVEIEGQPHTTFFKKNEKIFLYEWQEPIWLVKLDGFIGDYTNLMRVVTEADLEKAIEGRNIK